MSSGGFGKSVGALYNLLGALYCLSGLCEVFWGFVLSVGALAAWRDCSSCCATWHVPLIMPCNEDKAFDLNLFNAMQVGLRSDDD